MDMQYKKQKYIIFALAIIELLLVCVGNLRKISFCLIGNFLVFSIYCLLSTKDFVNLLKSRDLSLYYKYQGAMDSYNIFTIKIALRKETLTKEESKQMKHVLNYIFWFFVINIALVLAFLVHNLR